jgi:threonine dehydrogenase-like Zn-dependent dehydrogenase
MRALVWQGGAAFRLQSIPAPRPRQGEVVLDVARAGICGSDLHAYRGHAGPRKPPLILGHELVGRLSGLETLYAVFPLVGCGECQACERGQENRCPTRGLIGVTRPGGFAGKVALPANCLVPAPPGVGESLAVLAEPLAVGVGAFRGLLDGPPRPTLVVGCGSIGLLAVHYAAAHGQSVTAVDRLPNRREVALGLGAHTVFETVDDIPDGAFDLVLDAAGSSSSLAGALRATKPGGTVVVIGLAESVVPIPLADIVRRSITLRGHFAYSRDDFHAALEHLAVSTLDTDWVTELPLAAGASGFASLVREPHAVTKVVLITSPGGHDGQ